jgi:hypothetical protein
VRNLGINDGVQKNTLRGGLVVPAEEIPRIMAHKNAGALENMWALKFRIICHEVDWGPAVTSAKPLLCTGKVKYLHKRLHD